MVRCSKDHVVQSVIDTNESKCSFTSNRRVCEFIFTHACTRRGMKSISSTDRRYCAGEEIWAAIIFQIQSRVYRGKLNTIKIRKYFLPHKKQQTLSTKLLQSCVSIYFEIMHGLIFVSGIYFAKLHRLINI